MSAKYQTLKWLTTKLSRDDWLLYLNYLIGTVRGEQIDKHLRADSESHAVPPHVTQLLAKEIIQNASRHGKVAPTWDWFTELRDLVIGLPDPIQDDPEWKHRNPSDFFIRLLNQQMPSQETRRAQRIGLALGLFRDLEPLPNGFNLPAAIEQALGMPVDVFMRLGFATMAFRQCSCSGHPCTGTFSKEYLEEAEGAGLSGCSKSNWESFLQRVAITPERFRKECQPLMPSAGETRYPQFEFNPLRRYPIIDIGKGRYIAPDPYLIGERASFGVFYDLFELEGVAFSEPFGLCFERFVEQLLLSCMSPDDIWSAEKWDLPECRYRAPSKHVDLAVRGADHVVLIECKSMRTSLKLASQADSECVGKMVDRIAEAILKCAEHAASIRAGEWHADGLQGKNVICVVVTYGKMYAANSPFVRDAVNQHELLRKIQIPPWVILSLEELDAAVSLFDRGESFEEVVTRITADEDVFDPLLHQYKSQLGRNATSQFAKDKAAAFTGSMIPHE